MYKNDVFVGALSIGSLDEFSFTYDDAYISSKAVPLSLSLPVREATYRSENVFAFFEGLLPEGEMREALADRVRTTQGNTPALLAALCGECIGDIVILTEEMQARGYHGLPSGYRPLGEAEFEELLEPVSLSRLAAITESRISLTGAQAKISLYSASANPGISDWSLPYGLAASNFILKPQSARFANLVENEAFCMQLAARCGIETADTSLLKTRSAILLSKRFDRVTAPDNSMTRLFQEDVCQILGLLSSWKYQEHRGPGLSQVADVITRYVSDAIPATIQLFRRTLFNFLVGNCDAHGKNFSLVARPGSGLSLSPAYDLLSTTYYPELSTRMAMSINTEFERGKVTGEDFLAMADQIGIGKRQVVQEFRTMLTRIIENSPEVARNLASLGFDQADDIAQHVVGEAQSFIGLV
ncbi:MAG: HipA domain-containing protein [Eggerthellaceae bacterium]|nr:HipA domain-containing protein [Eggerthellaceae bacterium]